MAFQYASYSVPQAPPSSLATFMPQFEAGQQKRLDLQAGQALASLGQGPYQQPQQPQSLAALDPNAPQAVPQSNPQNPPTVGDRASELAAYNGSVAARESSGNPNAVNPKSGATGLYQFLPSTWQDLMQRHPELGLTPEGITDPAQQQKAMPVFTAENARQLAASGIQPNPTSLYAAHLLGGGGASKVLSQPDNTPLSAVVDPAALQANPQIAGLNVGQFKQWVSQQGQQGGGYAPPMARGGAPQQPQSGASPLPSRDTMLALFRSEATRPLAIAMATAAQNGQSPMGILDMALKRAQVETAQREATAPRLLNMGQTEVDANGQPIYTAPMAPPRSGPITIGTNKQTGAAVPFATINGQMVNTVDPTDPASNYDFNPANVAADKANATVDAKNAGAARAQLPSAQQAVENTNKAIDSLLSDKAGMDAQFGNIMGIPNQKLPAMWQSDMANFRNNLKQATGDAFLAARQMLKGGGSITDYEGAKGEAAYSRMQLAADNGDEEAFKAAANDFKTAVQEGYDKLNAAAKGAYAKGGSGIDAGTAAADPLGIR